MFALPAQTRLVPYLGSNGMRVEGMACVRSASTTRRSSWGTLL